MDAYRYLWAKTNRQEPESAWMYPLWAHLMDVGTVALQLWQKGLLPAYLKNQISQDLGLNETEAGHFLGLWLGLHDWGKAIPSFQYQHLPSKENLQESFGLYFRDHYQNSDHRMAHGHATILLLDRWVEKQVGFDPKEREVLKYMGAWIGFHHGNITVSKKLDEDKLGTWEDEQAGNGQWQEVQEALFEAVFTAWQKKYPFSFPRVRLSHPHWLIPFAGFVTTADWIGSMGEHFSDNKNTSPEDNLDEHLEKSWHHAEKALSAAGFNMVSKMEKQDFNQLFPALAKFEPRPLQAQGLTLPLADEPTLIIVEAPTGEGKTECALILANRQQASANQGIYMAMPTQAMSNGLFGRFKAFLSQTHREQDEVNTRLVHGNDFLSDAQAALLFSPSWDGILDEEEEGMTSSASEKTGIKTAQWFMPKKRALLAKYGLGTIDQVLLGGVLSKHFFLRLYGLAGKTIVFDEVHAYDAYMNSLLCTLLMWLKALNCQVVMLSATLPSKTRKEFQAAWMGKKWDEIQDDRMEEKPDEVPYPCLWTSQEEQPIHVGHDKTREQTTNLAWMSSDLATVAVKVREAYHDGATVAVVLNLVDRAQTLFESLQDLNKGTPPDAPNVYLFHARYPFHKRQEIEKNVLQRFKKDRSIQPAIMIATQVAEASLDLDFDVMFSDLAPVDLLLQRAGRLQRHKRIRPEGYESPTFYVLFKETEGIPEIQDISGYEQVYSALPLWRTYLTLKEKDQWHLPFDYRPLIEAVYPYTIETEPENLPKALQAKWEDKVSKYQGELEKKQGEAEKRIINMPSSSKSIIKKYQPAPILGDEENDQIPKYMRALTRLGDSISVICFHKSKDGKVFIKYPEEKNLDLERFENVETFLKQSAKSRHDLLKMLFLNGLSLSSKDIVEALRNARSEQPEWWKKIIRCLPMLKHHYPMVFEDEGWQLGESRVVQWDQEKGIMIVKKSQP